MLIQLHGSTQTSLAEYIVSDKLARGPTFSDNLSKNTLFEFTSPIKLRRVNVESMMKSGRKARREISGFTSPLVNVYPR